MEKRNIEGFENAFPGKIFPEFRSLGDAEMQSIRATIKRSLSLPETFDKLQLVHAIAERTKFCEGYDANDECFSLEKFLKEAGISVEAKVFINFRQFDEVDELYFDDVERFFQYMWYPASDDIDIFDNTLSWIVSISHDGEVFLVRLI